MTWMEGGEEEGRKEEELNARRLLFALFVPRIVIIYCLCGCIGVMFVAATTY